MAAAAAAPAAAAGTAQVNSDWEERKEGTFEL